jgi:DNA-binding CsgD family transcriptional regulator
MSATLDAVSAAVYVIASDGRLAHANRSGLDLLAQNTVVRESGGRLLPMNARFDQALSETLAAAAAGDNRSLGVPAAAVQVATRSGDRYVAYLLPLGATPGRWNGASHAAAAAVFVQKAALNLASAPELVAQAYNLTNKELNVLFAIVDVGGVPEVADILGLSQGTIKTHLRSVFAKTGARRQADLAKIITQFASPVAA